MASKTNYSRMTEAGFERHARARNNPGLAIRDMYEAGLPGSRCDDEDTDRLLGDLRHPLFNFAPGARDNRDVGKGKRVLLYKAVQHFDPTFGHHERQTTGDCVSHGGRNAVDCTRAVEILWRKQPEEWVARGATEAIYGSRGHVYQGMSCSQAARYVNSQGGVVLRKDYGYIDLSTYNSSTGTRWGGGRDRDTFSKLSNEAKEWQVKTVSLITTVEEARDAIAAGYAINVCSSHGFSSKRDERGFARKSGSWSHAMAWTAVNDEGSWDDGKTGLPGFLVQNSWGKWNSGPTSYGQPDGSFWIDYDTAQAMLNRRGAWVMSNVDGFPLRELPDFAMPAFG